MYGTKSCACYSKKWQCVDCPASQPAAPASCSAVPTCRAADRRSVRQRHHWPMRVWRRHVRVRRVRKMVVRNRELPGEAQRLEHRPLHPLVLVALCRVHVPLPGTRSGLHLCAERRRRDHHALLLPDARSRRRQPLHRPRVLRLRRRELYLLELGVAMHQPAPESLSDESTGRRKRVFRADQPLRLGEHDVLLRRHELVVRVSQGAASGGSGPNEYG